MAATSDRLSSDLKVALKARDAERLQTLRMAISALNYQRIERTRPLTDDEELDVLRKQVKQREDSIEEFRKGKREDLAGKEERERQILLGYLPKMLDATEVRGEVKKLLAGMPPETKFGDAMKSIMPAFKDRANGRMVQEIVREEMAARGSS